jgi:glycosyltransferase involved in cell wall biosynthesis
MPRDRFCVLHLDTSDRRPLAKGIGTLDVVNVYLAIKHAIGFIKILANEKPTITYIPISQNTLGFLRDSLFLISSKLFKKKVIVQLAGSDFQAFFQGSNWVMRRLIRFALKSVCRAVVEGECLKGVFDGIIPADRVRAVALGTDGTRLLAEGKSSGRHKGHDVVLFLSSLRRSKGFMDVVRSIPNVLEKEKDVEFVFAGEMRLTREEGTEIEEFIGRSNIAHVITFTGPVVGEDKVKLFHIADIFVLPSYNEGLPTVLMEALAAGLPIITTDVGAIKEVVVCGENGLYVEPGDSESIAERILFLLKDDNLRHEMKRRNRERFLKQYTPIHFVNRLSKVFEETLEN